MNIHIYICVYTYIYIYINLYMYIYTQFEARNQVDSSKYEDIVVIGALPRILALFRKNLVSTPPLCPSTFLGCRVW